MVSLEDFKTGSLLHDYEFDTFLYVTGMDDDRINLVVIHTWDEIPFIDHDAIIKSKYDKNEVTLNLLKNPSLLFKMLFGDKE